MNAPAVAGPTAARRRYASRPGALPAPRLAAARILVTLAATGVTSLLIGVRPLAAQGDTAARVLSIGDAARLAAHQSAPAMTARAQADQATARVHQRLSAFLPTVYGAAQETERVQNSASLLRFPPSPGPSPFGDLLPPGGILFPPIKSVDFRGYVADTLFSFGAIQRYRQSRTAERAYDASASSSAEEAAASAAAAYLTTQHGEAVVAARLADSSLAADLLNIARQQLSAGVGILLDVTRAQSQAAAARAQLISARSARDRSRLDLYRALGLPLDTRLVLTDSLSHLPIADTLPTESEEVERALHHRPDLRAVDEQLTAAEQQAGAIRAERLPALAVFGDKGVNGGNWNRLLNTYDWGVGITVPVFDGFRREGRIEEQEAATREIVVRRRDLRQQAAIAVRGAYLDLASAREQLDASNQQLQLTQQELDQARQRFRTGVAGNADVITASLDLNNARTLQIDALTNYQSARVSLARATGTVTELP